MARQNGAVERTEENAPSSVALGVGLMLAGCGLLTVNDAFMKALVSEYGVGQAVSLRGLIGTVMVVAAAPFMGGYRALLPKTTSRAAILTGLALANYFLFPFSLQFIPLADAIMLAYLSPVVVVALSPFLLGETVGWRRWSAVAVGLAGAALVIDPGGGAFHPAVAAPLAVAFILGFRDILTRRFIRGESVLSMVLLANLGSGLLGLTTLAQGWRPMDGTSILLVLLAAAFVTAAQYLMMAAFRQADASLLSCFKYSSILWAAALGWLFFDETLTLADMAGAVLIMFSGVLITLRTSRKARR
ncbi:MAG: DMT family transporter [Alphaproteobacteria bacterium]|nr:DMT family transporter [Alphaproteobacteria bacterium]